MISEILAIARNWAVIILALEGFALFLVVLFALYQVTRGLRRVIPRVAQALRRAQEILLGVTKIIERIMRWVTATLVRSISMVAAIRAGLASARHFLRKGR